MAIMKFTGGTGDSEQDARLLKLFGRFAFIEWRNDGPLELYTDGRLIKVRDESGQLLPGIRDVGGGKYACDVPSKMQRRYFVVGLKVDTEQFRTDRVELGFGGTIAEAITDAEKRFAYPIFDALREAVKTWG